MSVLLYVGIINILCLYHIKYYVMFSYMHCVRGLGFKFVDFLYKSSDVCLTDIKMISSENIFFYLSYKLLSIALLIIVSTQK